MISKKTTKTVIHFHEKIIDLKVLECYTTDFLMKLFVLAKKKYNNENIRNEKVKAAIAEVEANLLDNIKKYSQNLDIEKENMIEVKIMSDGKNPIVNSYSLLHEADQLLRVTFQKIDWDEINLFRKFLLRYLTTYLRKKTKKTGNEIKQIVTNLSFVIQEFLQNANLYGVGNHGYELIISNVDDKIMISVENYTDPKNAVQLQSIVDEICNAENMRELLLKYMLNSQKHLGLICSVFNNYITDLTCNINSDNLVHLEAVVVTEIKKV